MGLDTFASRSPEDIVLSEEDIQAFKDAEISLCGGLFSGDSGSFRGKVYASLILSLTGESLYEEWLPPETVHSMNKALAACDPEDAVAEISWPDHPPEDVIELRKFFKVCSERGLGLIGWW
jgi:hypothetical protein